MDLRTHLSGCFPRCPQGSPPSSNPPYLLTHLSMQYTNDSWMRAKTWAQLTGVFAPTDVVRVEREFLAVLEFKLRVDENALLLHYDPIMARCAPYTTTPWSPSYPLSPSASPPLTNAPNPMTPAYPLVNHPRFDLECTSSTSSRSASPLDTPPVRTPNNHTISPLSYDRKPYPPQNRQLHPYQLTKPDPGFGSHITSDLALDFSVQDLMDRYFPFNPAAPLSEDYNSSLKLPPSHLLPCLSHQSMRDPHPQSLPHITEILPPSILNPSSSTVLSSWP